MKSYSDNLPNVSTDEIRKSAQTAEETHNLVKGIINNIDIETKKIKKLNIAAIITAIINFIGIAILAAFMLINH